MQALLHVLCFLFFCAFITKKRANVLYPKIFDVFVSDWLKFLINFHEKIVVLAANYVGRVRVKMSCKLLSFLALREATEDDIGKMYSQRKSRSTTPIEGRSHFAKIALGH